MADYHYPPGPKPGHIFGNLLKFRKDQLGFITNLQRAYGDAATMYFFKTPAVLFTRPEAIRYVLIENARNFINRPVFESLRLVLGDGLLSIDGDFHRQQRRMVQPAFHKQRVESYCDTMVTCTESMLDEWTPGSQRDVADEMMRVTMRIVAKALFNIDIASQIEALSQAFSVASEYSRRSRAPISKALRLNLPFTPMAAMYAPASSSMTRWPRSLPSIAPAAKTAAMSSPCCSARKMMTAALCPISRCATKR